MAEGAPENGTSAANQVVYRPEAIAAHRQAREHFRASQYTSSRTLALLWATSLASVAFGVALVAVPVPAHVSGTAIVVPAAPSPGAGGEGLMLVAFFPPEARTRLAAGQRLLVDVSGKGVRLESHIKEVEQSVVSPEAALERFGLKGDSRQGPNGPTACAFAVFAPPGTEGLSATDWLGSTFRVEVEVGQQRLLTSLPILARFLKG
ncbi:hypothetical protein CYFUS_001247 [Cystobacter fuscus]|uniref:Uncharacterized protein n=1 Tax=Cystobacter fuscus TaxID=43 RepID=A0A250IX23_9BACT|nr:hypothetical protein [Cystobacter fuscus]ATB35833.1 hypothetical protein CYFUS_001247 [Cystobacter fuscus]